MRQMTLFQNPVKYRSHRVQRSTSFLCTSVTTIWPNWNVEVRCLTSLWLEQLQMIQFFHSSHGPSAASESAVLCTVSFSHPPGGCVWLLTGPLLQQPIPLTLFCLMFFSVSVIDVSVYIWPSSPSFSSSSSTVFQMDDFFPIQSVCNRWFLPDSTQLLTGCPRYDLLALLSVNALIDSYTWVPAIILFRQCW